MLSLDAEMFNFFHLWLQNISAIESGILVEFYGISTFLRYLTPNQVICK